MKKLDPLLSSKNFKPLMASPSHVRTQISIERLGHSRSIITRNPFESGNTSTPENKYKYHRSDQDSHKNQMKWKEQLHERHTGVTKHYV